MARGRQLLKWYDFISPNIPVGNGANYRSCPMRSKLSLQRLKPSVASGASSTRCPKRCLKRRRGLWRRKANSNVKSCEEWESSLMIEINANLPDLAPERCGDPQFGAPTPGRQGQSGTRSRATGPTEGWSPKCSSRERHCPDQKMVEKSCASVLRANSLN